MTKEEFLALAMPRDPDKAAVAVAILEHAWEVIQPALLEVARLEQQLREKLTPAEIEISVMQSLAMIMQRRLKKKTAGVRAFWANQREMERRKAKEFGARDEYGRSYPHEWAEPAPRYTASASIVVVSEKVENREALRGAILEPEGFTDLGCDPVQLLMLSPDDFKRVRAGELEVPSWFGVHWELIYPQGFDAEET